LRSRLRWTCVVVTDFGDFRIRLDRERAPNAASLFLTLASSGTTGSRFIA
jgi:cyclophilin family peptidyl-prolyl cis-trans isomerase